MANDMIGGVFARGKDGFVRGLRHWFGADENANENQAFVDNWQKFELEMMEKNDFKSDVRKKFESGREEPYVVYDYGEEKKDSPEKGKKEDGKKKGEEGEEGRKDVKGGSKDPRPATTQRSRDAVFEFGQKSTIHGLNKVLEKSSFFGRRLFWLFLVLTGCGLFVYQVTERILYYYQWPVAVNVKVNYNQTLRYPSVTICNQNSFRLSASAERDLYAMLDDMYSQTDLKHFDFDKYGVADLPMDELFNITAHTKENMIVDCWWGNDKCRADDFQTSFTDHGLCFTFNGRISDTPVRYISQTGADNGLRLRLNVEQYEYMRGPHDAAGLKLLIHDRHEIPFVRDLGEAIPTGSHAFIGIEVLEVKNLPYPHGNCSNKRDLQYYDFYSVTACRSDCITRAVSKKCDCRDTYMPELTPEHYHKIEEACDCPVPCDVTHYRPTLSYATTSSLNTDQLLQRNTTEQLSQQFVRAKETAQKVIEVNLKKDQTLFGALQTAKNNVEAVLPVFTSMMAVLDEYKDELLRELQPRTWWHKKWGLDQMKYAVDHDFKRGWDFMDERTFMHVTTGFYQMSSLYRRMIEVSLSSLNETVTRKAWYISTERDLYYREQLASRALDNYTHFYWSYTNATPVYEFVGTPNYHYDPYLIAPDIIRHNMPRLRYYFKKFSFYVTDYIEHIGKLRQISEQILNTANYSEAELEDSIWHFEKRSRNFNYYRYFTAQRLVYKACELADDVIEAFLERNKTLYEAANEVTITISNTFDLIKTFKNEAWSQIAETVDLAYGYTETNNISKTEVAALLTSKQMEERVRIAETFFKDMHRRAQQLTDDWQKFQLAYYGLWENMLGENTLKEFYPKLESDIEYLFATGELNVTDDYGKETIETLVEMFDITEDEFRTWSKEYLTERTNADFASLSMKEKVLEIQSKFDRDEVKLDGVMGNKADVFLNAIEKSRDKMREYLNSIQTNSAFIRENFLQVNVFMRELSYEEIEQRAAYDVIALLSDIGGSMGLFVGASVISVFEIIEMCIQSAAQKRRDRQNLKRLSTDC